MIPHIIPHIILISMATVLLGNCIYALVLNNKYRKRIHRVKSKKSREKKLTHSNSHIAALIVLTGGAALVTIANIVSLLTLSAEAEAYLDHATTIVYAAMALCTTWIVVHIQDEEGGKFKY